MLVNSLELSFAVFLYVLLWWLQSSEEEIKEFNRSGLFFLDSSVEIFLIAIAVSNNYFEQFAVHVYCHGVLR